MHVPHRRARFAAAAGLILIGTSAGCSSETTPAGMTEQETAAAGAMESTQGPGSSAKSTDEFADGSYMAVGSYQSPNGAETIDVELTLSDDLVSDVAVTSNPTNPTTKRFQGQFVHGIAEQVVGKPIDELDVSKVSGSSLTSGGFRDAIEQIKSEAQL